MVGDIRDQTYFSLMYLRLARGIGLGEAWAVPQPGFLLHHFLIELLFLPTSLAGMGMRTIMEGHS
jgi:hypothetical protein